MPVTSYSRTPANNNSAPPNGWPEGQSPGSVNNCARQLMTDIVNEASKGAARVLGSVAGTDTITAAMSPTLDGYSAGMIVVFTPANTNTGAATLNIDTLGAKTIRKMNGADVVAGDLQASVPAILVLNSAATTFYLINPPGTASFTGTLTGMSGATTGTVFYIVQGGICTLHLTSSILGTSNSSAMTMTGLPAAVRPSGTKGFNCSDISDNGNSNMQGGGTVSSAGVITFNLHVTNGVTNRVTRDAAAFTSSGSKGLLSQWQISYPL